MPFKLLGKRSEALSSGSNQSLQNSDPFIAKSRMYFKILFCNLTPKLKIPKCILAFSSQHFSDLIVSLQQLHFTKIVPDACISLTGIGTGGKNCMQVHIKLTWIDIK